MLEDFRKFDEVWEIFLNYQELVFMFVVWVRRILHIACSEHFTGKLEMVWETDKNENT